MDAISKSVYFKNLGSVVNLGFDDIYGKFIGSNLGSDPEMNAKLASILSKDAEFRSMSSELVGSIKSVQTVNLRLGDSYMNRHNGFLTRYRETLRFYESKISGSTIYAEDLDDSMSRYVDLCNEYRVFYNDVKGVAADPERAASMDVGDKSFFDKAQSLIHLAIFAGIVFGAIKIVPMIVSKGK